MRLGLVATVACGARSEVNGNMTFDDGQVARKGQFAVLRRPVF